jgi:hypothetical protein
MTSGSPFFSPDASSAVEPPPFPTSGFK